MGSPPKLVVDMDVESLGLGFAMRFITAGRAQKQFVLTQAPHAKSRTPTMTRRLGGLTRACVRVHS